MIKIYKVQLSFELNFFWSGMQNSFLVQYFNCDLEDAETKKFIGTNINYSGKMTNNDLSQMAQKITSNFNYFHGQGKLQNIKRFIELLEIVQGKQENIFISYINSLLFLQQTDFLLSARILATDAYSQFILTKDEYNIIITTILDVFKGVNQKHISNYYVSLVLRIYSNLLLNAHFISNQRLQDIIYSDNSKLAQKLMMQIAIEKAHLFAKQLSNNIEYTNETIIQIRLIKQFAYYLTYLLACNYLSFNKIIGLIEYANSYAQNGGIFALFAYISITSRDICRIDSICYLRYFIDDFLFNILQYLEESDEAGQKYLATISQLISAYSNVLKTYTDIKNTAVNINYTKLFYQDNLFLLSNKTPYCTLIQYYAQQMHLNKVTLCTNIIEDIKYQMEYMKENQTQYIDIYKNQLIRIEQIEKYFSIGEKGFSESCVIYQINEQKNDITQFYVIKITQYDENYCQVENNHVFSNYSDHNRYILLKQHQSIYIQSYQSIQNLSLVMQIMCYQQNLADRSIYKGIKNKITLLNIVLQNKKIYETVGQTTLKYPLLSFGKITNNILNILNSTLQDTIQNKVELLNTKLLFDKATYSLQFNNIKLTQSLELYKHLYHLRESQFACLLHIFIKDFLVIIGAPGTGKTYTILQIIRSMLLISRSTFKILPNRPLTTEQQYFKQCHQIQYATSYFDLIFSKKPKHQIIFVSHSNKAVNQLNKKFYPSPFPLSVPFIYRNISEEKDLKYTTYYYINKIYGEMFPDGTKNQVDQQLKAINQHLNAIRDHRAYVFSNFKALETHLITNSMLLISTTTMIDKHYQILLNQQSTSEGFSPIIIVEEAARISSYNLSQIIFLCPYKIILLGDFLQLPSVIKEKSLEYDINMTISLFERFAVQRPEVILLNEQYRCPSQICDLYRDIYATCLPSILSRPLVDAPNVLGIRQIKAEEESDSEASETTNITSTNRRISCSLQNQFLQYHQVLGQFNDERNIEEVKYVIELVKKLLNKHKSTEITVLTLYKKQQNIIHSSLINNKLKVGVFTVDEYQGLENDAIIFSLVSRNPSPYANDLRRSIVAVSRAKVCLHIVGDIRMYDNEVFLNVKKMLFKKGTLKGTDDEKRVLL